MYSEKLVKEVAQMYYFKGLTQSQIAKKVYCSTSTISRILKYGIDSGIVKINIENSVSRVTHLEDMIKEKFNINDVRISKTVEDDIPIFQLACEKLEEELEKSEVVGISRGRAIRGMVDAYDGKIFKDKCIVQVIGIVNTEESYEGPKILDIIANKTKCNAQYLFAPFAVFNDEAKKELMKLPNIASTFEKIDHCDVVISGISDFDFRSKTTFWGDLMTDELISYFEERNAVGSLLGTVLDKDGNIIPADIYSNVFAKGLEFYKNNTRMVIVGFGEEKAKVLFAILKAGFIETLITDEKTAYMIYVMSLLD